MNRQPMNLAPRAQQERNLSVCRTNILLLSFITLVNVILLITGADIYFLFSASIPYYITVYGMAFTGMLPEEYYGGVYNLLEFLDPVFFYIMLVIAFVVIAAYVALGILSKKYPVCTFITAALFALDTIFLIYNIFSYGFDTNSIFDILMHAWVIYYLVIGIIAIKKLKELPPDDTYIPGVNGADGMNGNVFPSFGGVVENGATAAAADEKSEFDVFLTDVGDNKLDVINVVCEITGLGFADAENAVESCPKAIREGITKDEAEAAKKQLEAVGASVEIK